MAVCYEDDVLGLAVGHVRGLQVLDLRDEGVDAVRNLGCGSVCVQRDFGLVVLVRWKSIFFSRFSSEGRLKEGGRGGYVLAVFATVTPDIPFAVLVEPVGLAQFADRFRFHPFVLAVKSTPESADHIFL